MTGIKFLVHGSKLRFTEAEMREELHRFPERFSPNVILRGLFQEMILPNLGFIGGGGETAYWLELKALFDHYQVPFPVLILRNSFLLIDRQGQEKIDRAGLSLTDLFRPRMSWSARSSAVNPGIRSRWSARSVKRTATMKH